MKFRKLTAAIAVAFATLFAGSAFGATLSVTHDFDALFDNNTSSVTLFENNVEGPLSASVTASADTAAGILSISTVDSLGAPIPVPFQLGDITVTQDGNLLTPIFGGDGIRIDIANLVANTASEFVFTVANITDPFDLQVKITAIPLPAAAWLFISALAGLGVIGRRRRVAA